MTPTERARQIDAEEFRRDSERALARALEYSRQKRDERRRQSLIYIFGEADRTMPLWSTYPSAPIPTYQRPAAPVRRGPPPKTYFVNGTRLTLIEWANRIGLTIEGLRSRAKALGSMEAAIRAGNKPTKKVKAPRKPRKLFTAAGLTMTRGQWARHLGIDYAAMLKRIERHGIERAVAMGSGDQRASRHRPSNDNAPGVVSDFPPSWETGAGAVLQETPKITFSEKAKSA